MRTLSILTILLACSALMAFENTSTSRNANVKVLSSADAFVPGQTVTLVLLFDMKPDWHIYWKNPGDSGLPPKVKWTLPKGWTASEIQFPTPEKLVSPGGTNFVYHKQVALLVDVVVPESQAVGPNVTLQADLKWLVCDADQCLPESQSVSISLPIKELSSLVRVDEFEKWKNAVRVGESYDPASVDAGR